MQNTLLNRLMTCYGVVLYTIVIRSSRLSVAGYFNTAICRPTINHFDRFYDIANANSSS